MRCCGGGYRCSSAIAWLVGGCLLLASGCDRYQKKEWTITGPTMGTQFTVKLAELPKNHSLDSLKSGILLVLKTVNDQMSTYQENSEVSRFNRYPLGEWFPVSKNTAQVVQTALNISKMTDGAFDITVGPLVNLWGFGPTTQTQQIPSEEQIQKTLSHIGYQKIEVQKNAIRKKQSTVSIDLSAIAKGFAVDKIAEYVNIQGISSFMVDIGGEIRTQGIHPEGRPWRIAIESPVAQLRQVQKVVILQDMGMATSGDYRNYFEVGNKRFSHTIDPRTGQPIDHNLASVTVVHPQCMLADALATAFMAMGVEKGYPLAVQHHMAVFFIIKDGGHFVEKATPAFMEMFKVKT